MAGGFIRTLATVAAKRRSTSVMRRRVRCGAALGSRTMWPVIGGGGSAMSYGGRSAGSGSNGADGGADRRDDEALGDCVGPLAVRPHWA
jgi:hypothetical protein